MKLSTIQFTPAFKLPTSLALFRVQRIKSRPGCRRLGPLLLPPPGLLANRFDLATDLVGYFAESPEAAAYETLGRRNATGLSMANLGNRTLLCVHVKAELHLLDLRHHVSSWPVLQSERYAATQELASEAQAAGFQGVVYRSAQQFGADCYAIFGDYLKQVKPAWAEPLLEPGTGNLHSLVATVQRGSQLIFTP